jgi:hypothetical protein
VPALLHGIRCKWEVSDPVFMIRVFDVSRIQGVSGVATYRPEFDSV